MLYSLNSFAYSAVETMFNFYEISPETNKDIKLQIEANTPLVQDNIKYHGGTSWQVQWSINWKKNRNICYISSSNTKLYVVFTMPRIANNFTVSENIRETFDHYYKALIKHEFLHRDHGELALSEVTSSLAHFSSFSSCERLNSAVEKMVNDIVTKYKKLDKELDQQTKHGKLQGVEFN